MDKFYNPVRSYEGYHCIQELSNVLSDIDKKIENILVIVWNENIKENEDIQSVIKECNQYQWKFISFDVSNPEITDLYQLYLDTKEDDFDLIIAIGGGSVLDVGKSLCCLYGEEISDVEMLRQKIREKSLKKGKCSWIGVPTTAGTGSEVTCWATIWDSKKNSKLSIEHQSNYAYASFVDPQFAETMPVSLAVSSALDAVSHATEAYWAKAANLVSSNFACQAISQIMQHITELTDEEKKHAAHDYMAKGSMLAGMAFSNTKTTACHSLSYPLTMNYHIPHGIAVSMLLTEVMKKNQPYIHDIERLLEAYGVESISELEDKIKSIFKMAGIPYQLRNWNVKKEDFDMLAQQSSTKGRIDNNPADLTKEDIIEILENIY